MEFWHNLDPSAPALDALGRRETRRANAALRDFLQSEPPRSLEALLARYLGAAQPPARSLKTLKTWAARYDWQARAAFYDRQCRDNAESAAQECQRRIMQSGLALPAGRVESLKQLYAELHEYYRCLLTAWHADLQAGVEAPANTPRFNTGIIIQLRGILDDLARETGGRAARAVINTSEASAPEEQPPDLSLLSREEMRELARLLRKASPAASQPDALRQSLLPGFAP